MNVFQDQARFMQACGQTTDTYNADQYALYRRLIDEEVGELQQAVSTDDRVEQLDALIDILVVTIGALHSAGFDAEGAWQEVMKTNFAKINPDTGLVNKREDGKVLKPAGWKAPDLKSFVSK